mgnify:CR=1 FL=1
MKNITAVGYLTNDCEVNKVEGKPTSVRFSIAVDDGYGENKGTIFFSCSYFRTGLAQYLVKGKLVAVSGDLKRNDYEGKTYLNIWANEVTLLGGKSQGSMNVQDAANEVSDKEKARYPEGSSIEVDTSRDASLEDREVDPNKFDDEIPF